VARRPTQIEQHPLPSSGAPSSAWESRLDVIIAIALGLAAIVTAGSVYFNEHQEHKANLDFHQATHELLQATVVGIRSPAGRARELHSTQEVEAAENHQERASRYTLAEVILATSLFLFGVAGISSRWRIKLGALGTATGVFLVAVALLVTV
jgi:Flp pilus assembly protein TadB